MNRNEAGATRISKSAYLYSLLVGLLVLGVSLVGLVAPNKIYPTLELRHSFVVNDVVNLGVGLPILLLSMRYAQRGRLVGLLLWPGALLFVMYNYIAYLFGIPVGAITSGYLVLVLLSAYLIFYLIKHIDGAFVRQRLEGAAPVKSASWIMILFGGAFFFRAANLLFQALTGRITLPASETGVLLADIIVSVLWFSGGIMLLRGMDLGYVCGLGLLFAASMLFVALIFFLLLQPLLTGAQFALVDVLIVLIMGIVCSIPLILFLRVAALKG